MNHYTYYECLQNYVDINYLFLLLCKFDNVLSIQFNIIDSNLFNNSDFTKLIMIIWKTTVRGKVLSIQLGR